MKKWTLGQVRGLTIILALLTLTLVPLGGMLKNAVILYAGLICYIAAAVLWLTKNRCPHCGCHLGTSTSLYCPKCKERL